MAALKLETLLTPEQMKKCGFVRNTHSDTRPRFAVQIRRRNVGELHNEAFLVVYFSIVKCIVKST